MSRVGADGADRLLAFASRLLPAERRDWGRAMRAESAAIESGRDRWTYVLSCVRVVLVQPAAVRSVGYPLLALTLLVFVLRWSGGIAYAPLRWGVVATVALLVGVAWWGRHRGVLGPVGGSRVSRAVRAGGCLLVGAITAAFVAAAGFWAAIQLAFPPVSANIGGSVVTLVFAIAAVVSVGAKVDRSSRNTLFAVLCVAILAPLLVFVEVLLLSSYGPAWLIPDLVPAALSPADDLANSRIEIQDPYVAMLFLASLSALVLTVASIARAARQIAAKSR